ncbi:Uncharacterized protein OBRU01_08555 [Operophtera brumata]|uniref:Uncharacterized protein n=1 Tax=Operophtera brumata TaxID=104452 RepID=A0A0L7LH19_OPEBR|nr:Uncharacterized protein OBRU01_08555 [Operophtera brumata]
MTSLNLYKYLLRQCERLPPDACKHYKFAVRQVRLLHFGLIIYCLSYVLTFSELFYLFQSFIQHKFEPDPQRVKEIISKSIEDSKWIVNKVKSKQSTAMYEC